MKRRLSNAVACLSLGLLLATTALWIRSYWYEDGLSLWRDNVYVIASSGGGILLEMQKLFNRRASMRGFPTPDTPWEKLRSNDIWPTWRAILVEDAGPRPEWGLTKDPRGSWMSMGIESKSESLGVHLPHALYAAIFAVFPVARGAAAWHRNTRKQKLICPACGYDLRGTPESKACPECGAAPGTPGKWETNPV